MQTYELMMITNGGLDEPAVQGVVDRFTKLITDQGGTVEKIDHWGKRQLAYEIKHMTEGYYTVVEFQLSGEGLTELDRQLGITDAIVRHKIIRPGRRVKKRAS